MTSLFHPWKNLAEVIWYWHQYKGWPDWLKSKSLTYLLTYLLTYSMEQSPSWEANWFLASQEIPRILWKPKVHYPIHKCPHLSLSRARSTQSMPPSHFQKIHLNIIIPSTPGSSKWSLSFRYFYQNPVCTSPLPIRATRHAHLFPFDFTIRIIFGEKYRSWRSPLCSFLYSTITSSFLVPDIPLSTLLWNILILRSSLNVCDHVSHPYKTAGKIIVLYALIVIFLESKLEDRRLYT